MEYSGIGIFDFKYKQNAIQYGGDLYMVKSDPVNTDFLMFFSLSTVVRGRRGITWRG